MSDQAISALKTAVQVENNGLLTYLKFARKTRDEFGKNMFIQLALDEFEHRRILEEQLEKLQKGKPCEKLEIPQSELEQLLPKIKEKDLKTKGEAGLQDLEALNIALELERKAAGFFEEKARLVEDEAAKDLFLRLAKWENVHFNIIQAEIDTINKTGFWFGMAEFRMDGKY